MLRVSDRLSGSSLPGSPGVSRSNKFSIVKVGSAPPSDRWTCGAEGNLALACGPRCGRSAGCFESFSEDTERASGTIAVGIGGVRSALGVRGGVEGTRIVLDSAGETKGIIGMLEGIESDFSKNRADVDPVMGATAGATAGDVGCRNGNVDFVELPVSDVFGESADAAVPESATQVVAGDSEGIIGLHVSQTSFDNSSNLLGCVAAVACAGLPAVPGVSARVCSVSSSSAVSAAVAHARSTPIHDAHNSWSDTVRSQGPTGTRRVSGPAEDLRPVSEVEAGVNFRPAGGVRGQVAGSLPRRQPGTGTRLDKGGVVTPSLHPEVPGIQFVSPGCGLDIRQSMGWTKVCGTARSGIWVLKGNARTRMLPENLDHLRVRWISRGSYETAWVTPGHDCLCSYQYGHGAAIRPQTNDAIWHGVIGLWGRVAPLLSPWCARREVPTGVNLNQYSGPSSCIRWHSDNEPLFGPQNAPKLIVSMSLGNSVEFKVRRGQGNVPSLITLDHGDLLVMDGLTQSEYVHCTASGLQGPRVNLTFRWVAQHIASCPLAGAVGCVLPSCVQGLAEPGPRGEWGWGNKWSSSWGLVLLLLILVSVLLIGTLINIRRGHRNSGQRPSCSVVHVPSRGRARWVGGRRWPLSRRRQTIQGCVFLFPLYFFWGNMLYSFFQEYDYRFFFSAGYARSGCPHHATMMHIRWAPLNGHYGRKAGKSIMRPRFPPLSDVSFW